MQVLCSRKINTRDANDRDHLLSQRYRVSVPDSQRKQCFGFICCRAYLPRFARPHRSKVSKSELKKINGFRLELKRRNYVNIYPLAVRYSEKCLTKYLCVRVEYTTYHYLINLYVTGKYLPSYLSTWYILELWSTVHKPSLVVNELYR